MRENYGDSALIDAQNNKTSYIYDGFDRLSSILFPTANPVGAGTSNAGDHEDYTYDANGIMVTVH